MIVLWILLSVLSFSHQNVLFVEKGLVYTSSNSWTLFFDFDMNKLKLDVEEVHRSVEKNCDDLIAKVALLRQSNSLAGRKPILVVLLVCVISLDATPMFFLRDRLSASFNHWTIYIPFNVTDMSSIIQRLSDNATSFENNVNNLLGDLIKEISDESLLNSLNSLRNATTTNLKLLNSEVEKIESTVGRIQGKSSRQKRGIAYQADKAEIERKIADRKESLKNLENVVELTESVAKNNEANVEANKIIIEDLERGMDAMEKSLFNMGDKMKSVEKIHDVYMKLEELLLGCISAAESVLLKATQLEMEFGLVQAGILPRSLITSHALKKYIRSVYDSLPPKISLPHKIEDIDDFYETAQTYLVKIKDGFSVQVMIPLLSTENFFDIYQIFNFPVPKRFNETVYRAQYKLSDASYLAITPDSSRFILLKGTEMEFFLASGHNYFRVDQPIEMTQSSADCTIALYLKDRAKTVKNCHTVILPNSMHESDAIYLNDGNWVVLSVVHDKLRIRCNNGTNVEIEVDEVSYQHFHLPAGCSASTSELVFPEYFTGSTNITTKTIKEQLNQFLNFSVWDDMFNDTTLQFSDIVPEIENLPDIPDSGVTLETLSNHLRLAKMALRSPSLEDHSSFTLPFSVCVVVFVSLVVLFRKQVFLCCRRIANRLADERQAKLSKATLTSKSPKGFLKRAVDTSSLKRGIGF